MMRPSVTVIALTLALWSHGTSHACSTDISGDGRTDGIDLSVVLAQWGSCASGASCQGDLDGDGTVGGADITSLLAAWGPCATVPAWATLIEAAPDPAVVSDAALRASIIATGLAWRVLDTATQIEFLLVPPGEFDLGCSPSLQDGCWSGESPVHGVTLTHAFYIGRYEVTQAQWQARMGSNPSWFQDATPEVPGPQVPNRPVEQVSWDSIQEFLVATSMRLPTEAEWEYAYRAGTTTAFHSMPGHPSGTNDSSLIAIIAWIHGNAASQTWPVGQKARNGLGLHDMAGNVYEWVSDWYGLYPVREQVDPTGPVLGSQRVARGGSWASFATYARASYRGYGLPELPFSDTGFRVARNP